MQANHCCVAAYLLILPLSLFAPRTTRGPAQPGGPFFPSFRRAERTISNIGNAETFASSRFAAARSLNNFASSDMRAWCLYQRLIDDWIASKPHRPQAKNLSAIPNRMVLGQPCWPPSSPSPFEPGYSPVVSRSGMITSGDPLIQTASLFRQAEPPLSND